MMGYQEIISEKKQDFKMPDIHAHANLKDEKDVMDRVHKERKSRGVVIYATNELYDKLSTF